MPAQSGFRPIEEGDKGGWPPLILGMGENGKDVLLERFETLKTPHVLLGGVAGSGKSFLAKLEMIRWAERRVPLVVFDYSGEYSKLIARLGGEIVSLGTSGRQALNPLDFSHHLARTREPLSEHIEKIERLMRMMLRSEYWDETLSDKEAMGLFRAAVTETYRHYRYIPGNAESQRHATKERMPTLSEVAAMLYQRAAAERDDERRERGYLLYLALRRFTGNGPLAGLFDRRTTFPIEDTPLCIDCSQLFGSLLPMVISMTIDFLQAAWPAGVPGQQRLLFIEESQSLFTFPEATEQIATLMETATNWGLGISLMAGTVSPFLEDGVAARIRRQLGAYVLLRQPKSAVEKLSLIGELTVEEQDRLAGLAMGHGLLVSDVQTAWFSALGTASQLEYLMISRRDR